MYAETGHEEDQKLRVRMLSGVRNGAQGSEGVLILRTRLSGPDILGFEPL